MHIIHDHDATQTTDNAASNVNQARAKLSAGWSAPDVLWVATAEVDALPPPPWTYVCTAELEAVLALLSGSELPVAADPALGVPVPPSPLHTYPPKPPPVVRAWLAVPMTIPVPPLARLIAVPPTVIAALPGCRVCEPMMYAELLSAITTEEPIVMGGRLVGVVAARRVETEDPTRSTVSEAPVDRAMIVVEGPEPSVMLLPGASVWPATTKCEDESAAIVLSPTTMACGVLDSGVAAGGVIVAIEVPTWMIVWEDPVDRTTIAAAEPDPMVYVLPGVRVSPSTTRFEEESRETVTEPTTMGRGAAVLAGWTELPSFAEA